MAADAYYDKTVLLLPMNGSNNGTTFTDYSYSAKTVTANGGAKTATAQYKYYDSSGYFDGAGDYLSIADQTDLELGSGDWTLECWVRLEGYSSSYSGAYRSVFIGKDTSGARAYHFGVVGTASSWTNLVWSTAGTELTATWTPSNGTWYHVAVCKSGTTLRFFVDGTQVGADQTHNTSIADVSTATTVGSILYSGFQYYLNGYLQDVRITKGQARYTGTFTPPTKLIGTLSGTVKDDTNANAVRSVVAVLRDYPTLRLPYTTTSAGDGTWSITVPDNNYIMMCLDDAAGTTYNDLVYGGVTPV